MLKRSSSRWLQIAAIACAIGALLVVFLWQAYCWWLSYDANRAALPARFGNTGRNLAAASSAGTADTAEIRFIALGDLGSKAIGPELVRELGTYKPDFAVLLGDVAWSGTPADHLYLRRALNTTLKTGFPVFYAPGNHDVGPGFTLDRWEAAYGPSHCFFTRGGNLFIIARIPQFTEPDDDRGVQQLQETLRQHAAGAKRIFVFNHIPPGLGFEWSARTLHHQEKLLKLLEDYKVSYLITGDYHSYVRVQRGPTTILVSGGGGSKLKGGSLGFHHGMVFTIHDGAIQERICTVPAAWEFPNRVEYAALVNSVPFMRQHPMVVVATDLIDACLLFLLVRLCLRLRKTRSLAPHAGQAEQGIVHA